MITVEDYPKISIITAFFNAERFIADAIESVLNQSYSNWELLLINDGSTDSSKQVVQQFLDSRIVYFEQSNAGVAAARNRGLQCMTGEYFCFLDADDILPYDSLRSRLAKFRSDPSLEFVDGRVLVFDLDSGKIERSWVPNFSGNPFRDLISLSGRSFFGPTWMIKRSARRYEMNEALTHSEDLLFYMELSRGNGIYAYTDDVVLVYRNRPGSAMKNLKGLENGYRLVYKIICGWDEMDAVSLGNYRQRTKRIMVLCYLRCIKIRDAWGVFRNWL